MPVSTIESHPQKSLIVDRILAGLTIREVCKGLVPSVGTMTVQRYKSSVVKPLLARVNSSPALIREEIDPNPTSVPLVSDPEQANVVRQAIKDAPVASIFRQRLEKTYGVLDRALDKAENAVRVTYDKKGNEVAVAMDLSAIAPLANQMHKGLEILGRATGELEPQGGTGISIQIVLPRSGSGEQAEPRISYASADTIEIEQEGDAVIEIGLLQKP